MYITNVAAGKCGANLTSICRWLMHNTLLSYKLHFALRICIIKLVK